VGEKEEEVEEEVEMKIGSNFCQNVLLYTSNVLMLGKASIKKKALFVVFYYKGVRTPPPPPFVVPWESEIFWSIFLLWWMP